MNNTLSFIKFGKKEHLESMQKGKLHLFSLEHYKKLEDKENNSYIGDKNEGTWLMNDCKVILNSLNGDEIIFSIPKCTSKIEFKEIDKSPILCMASLTLDDLEAIPDKPNNFKVKFNERIENEFSREEWEYALIIDTAKFLGRIVEYTEKNNVYFKADYVQYDDFKVNYQSRFIDFEKDYKNIAFYKDLKYKNQREYRVSFNSLQIDEDEALVIDIGDMSDFTCIMKREKLFNDMCIGITPKKVENIK